MQCFSQSQCGRDFWVFIWYLFPLNFHGWYKTEIRQQSKSVDSLFLLILPLIFGNYCNNLWSLIFLLFSKKNICIMCTDATNLNEKPMTRALKIWFYRSQPRLPTHVSRAWNLPYNLGLCPAGSILVFASILLLY